MRLASFAWLAAMLAALTLCGGSTASAGSFTYIYPVPAGTTYSLAFGVNDLDQVVGYYQNGIGPIQGFIWSNGSATTITVAGNPSITELDGINDRGMAVGYAEQPHKMNAIVFKPATGRAFRPIPGPDLTTLVAINKSGVAVGYSQATSQSAVHGLILVGSKVTLFDAPGALNTYPAAINDSSEVAGYFVGSDGMYHGFTYQGGVSQVHDIGSGTFITSITPMGAFGGYTTVAVNGVATNEAFYNDGGVVTMFGYPGATDVRLAGVASAGPRATPTFYANWFDSSDRPHAFTRQAGVTRSLSVGGTSLVFIRQVGTNGSIVGWYTDPGQEVTHGFIGACAAVPCTR